MRYNTRPCEAVGDPLVLEPVFIIGCPRSGTTLTLDLVASHGAFAWVSNKLNENPQKLELTALNRVYHLPLAGKYLYVNRHRRPLRRLPTPVEPWQFWDAYLACFRWPMGGPIPPRRRSADDITTEEIKRIRTVIDRICRYQNRRRFLSKYTDFPRITYLSQAFPDARFIHIVRDGRATAYSLYDCFMTKWPRYWDARAWWVSGWPAPWRDEWNQRYGCVLSFSAYLWKFFVTEIWKDARSLSGNRYLEVQYRDLISAPDTVLAGMFEFCGLEMSPSAAWHHRRVPLVNRNHKWQARLDDKQKAMLGEIIHEGEFRRVLDDEPWADRSQAGIDP
jgi:omega-hydroxy-beta-dihydromenaquinone-9 sulfotransferase